MHTKTKILIEVGSMPDPETSRKAEKRDCSPEEKVRKALELINSGYDSAVEWIMINKLYRKLSSIKKPNTRVKNILKMISPVLSKYGYKGVGSENY